MRKIEKNKDGKNVFKIVTNVMEYYEDYGDYSEITGLDCMLIIIKCFFIAVIVALFVIGVTADSSSLDNSYMQNTINNNNYNAYHYQQMQVQQNIANQQQYLRQEQQNRYRQQQAQYAADSMHERAMRKYRTTNYGGY